MKLPNWLTPRSRRIVAVDPVPEAISEVEADLSAGFANATNVARPVIELVRPHLRVPDCLIVTGYQDFLSSLSIIMREVPEIALEGGARIRIAFGVNTAGAASLAGRGRPVPEIARQHYLGRHGLSVEDQADYGAVLALEAVRAGRIDLRVFDPEIAKERLGGGTGRVLHSKIVASARGAVAGSANFSRAGLYRNIEYADGAETEGAGATSAAVAQDRRQAAEEVWTASTDWNAAAIEILEGLLRPVSCADAAARTVHEQRSFAPWRVDGQADITGRLPLPHQADLVYEASSVVYEHGLDFVGAPTGSGKTDIGKLLGHTLGMSFERIFGQDHTGRLPRGGALAIVPPRVFPGWDADRPRGLEVERNTMIAPRRSGRISLATSDETGQSPTSGRDRRTDLTRYGALILDECHTVTPGFDESSRRAEAVEFAPPSWNVCLSATLLGNRDVDWLAHLHEKRASIFMTPGYLRAMQDLFDRESSIEAMMRGEVNAEALGEEARASLSDLLSPFVVLRTRDCIGESSNRSGRAKSYPPFRIHPRPRSLDLSDRQKEVMAEISALAENLAPGRRLTSVTVSRFGNRAERQHNQTSLYARNLVNVLRANSAQALWEMRHGAIGAALRRFEEDQVRRSRAPSNDVRQLDLFRALGVEEPKITPPEAPICDRLIRRLARPDIQRIDERRYAEALRIQRAHHRVVFLAERIDTLELFAANLARLRDGTEAHIQYMATSGETEGGRRRARLDVLGDGDPGFKTIKQGHRIEDFFRPGGRKSDGSPASVFMTYQMAEGINLQSADALVLLGITSNLKDLLQGMGRIDRIDSPHALTHYHLIDVPVAAIASDEKVGRRIENYRLLVGSTDAPQDETDLDGEAEPDTEIILGEVARYLRAPRHLRTGNFHDLLETTRRIIEPARYRRVAAAAPEALWGAEIALLESARPFTLLHLRGEHARPGRFAPPRLLVIEEDGTLERNQVRCAARLRSALAEMNAQGILEAVPDRARLHRAIEDLGTRIAGLREWQLAPERTDSLLGSLAVFLAGEDGEPADPEALFGELSLRGVEYLAETWSRLLDPYWVRAKEEVRDRFARGAAQSYISIAEMTDELAADPDGAARVREVMLEALEEAGRIAAPDPDAVGARVSVAFVSVKAALH